MEIYTYKWSRDKPSCNGSTEMSYQLHTPAVLLRENELQVTGHAQPGDNDIQSWLARVIETFQKLELMSKLTVKLPDSGTAVPLGWQLKPP